MSDVVSYLESRGLVEEKSSNKIKEIFLSPRVLYLGIDPTAPSLHLGNLQGLIVLKIFQMFGHKPVVVMGGATAAIGDPSGKSTERPILSKEEIASNIIRIQKTVEGCLDFSVEATKPVIVNNADWYEGMTMLNFLRDIGKQFRLGPMLGKESVRTRLDSEEGMSFTEFSYQLLQGYDFAHLHKTLNIDLQIGGSDQYGNITAGIDCTRKVLGKSVYGLVFPLLTRSDGKKFGKTEDGAIFLDKDMLSPFQFYQHLIKFPDSDMISLIKKLTFIPLNTIDELEDKSVKGEMKPFDLQKILAKELTTLVHGEEGLKEAIAATEAMNIGSTEIDMEGIKNALSGLPKITLEKKDVVGTLYLDLLCKSGLLSSKGEARRLIKNNGAYLNKVRVEDANLEILESHLLDGELLLLSSGKKKTLVIQIN